MFSKLTHLFALKGFAGKAVIALTVPAVLFAGSGLAFGLTTVFAPDLAKRGKEMIQEYLLENILPTGAKTGQGLPRDTRLLMALHQAALNILEDGRTYSGDLALSNPAGAFRDLTIPPLVGGPGYGQSALLDGDDQGRKPRPLPLLDQNVPLQISMAMGSGGAPSGNSGFGSRGGSTQSTEPGNQGKEPVINIVYTPVPVPAAVWVLGFLLTPVLLFGRRFRHGIPARS